MDDILNLFLQTQHQEGMQLARESDLLELEALDPLRFVATYTCRGLVRDAAGAVREHDRFVVGIRFPESYHSEVDPARILTWMGPAEVWNPQVAPPWVCIGKIAPATPLVDLLHRVFEVITYDNVGMQEHDSLNRACCSWARRNRELFPIDRRPIKRAGPAPAIQIEEASP